MKLRSGFYYPHADGTWRRYIGSAPATAGSRAVGPVNPFKPVFKRKYRPKKKSFRKRRKTGMSSTGVISNKAIKRRKPRSKKKKFSKKVKDIIRKVEEDGHPVGNYIKEWVGDLSPINFGVPVGSPAVAPSGWWWCFSHLINSDNASPRTNNALRFTPITAAKILDAASVLFNSKPTSLDFTVAGGNQLDPKTTIVNVHYASAQWEIKNNSELTIELTEYIINNKDNTNQAFMDTWKKMLDNESYSGTLPELNATKAVGKGSTVVNATSDYAFIANYNSMHPGQCEGMHKRYSWTKKVMVMEPGTTMKRYFKYGNSAVDYSKTMDNQGAFAQFVKGEIQVIYKLGVKLDHSWKVESTDHGGSIKVGNAIQNAARGIDIYRKETYVLGCVENGNYQKESKVFLADYGNVTYEDSAGQIDPTSHSSAPIASG